MSVKTIKGIIERKSSERKRVMTRERVREREDRRRKNEEIRMKKEETTT